MTFFGWRSTFLPKLSFFPICSVVERASPWQGSSRKTGVATPKQFLPTASSDPRPLKCSNSHILQRCSDAQILGCCNTRMRKYSLNIRILRSSKEARMFRCSDVQMLGFSDAQMLGCADALILLQLMLMLPASVVSDTSTSAKSFTLQLSHLPGIMLFHPFLYNCCRHFGNFATAVEE